MSNETKVHVVILDDNGHEIAMVPTIERVFVIQWTRFFEKFGRYPEPDEALFFDPDADEPRQLVGQAFEDEFIGVAREVGVPECEIYALRKTGLLHRVGDIDFDLTKEDKAGWDAAVAEFDLRH